MGSSWSVAVASFRERGLLDACLEGILPQARARGAEVVVARAGDGPAVPPEPAGVRFVEAPGDASVPLLRGLALGACAGERVALTEDHCVPQPGWLEALERAHDAGARVVGGAMGNARTDRAIDCGAFFAEYGFFGPQAAGPGAPIAPTGANVSYAGELAREIGGWFREGLWENVANERLAARDTAVAFAPDALVHQNHRYALGAFCRDRFDHGFAYARRRLVDEGSIRRWPYLAATPLLPFLLLRRVAAAARHGREGEFLRALPFTLTFLAAWSVGEAAGYARGPAEVARAA